MKNVKNDLRVARALRGLGGVKAPETLLPAVMRRVGLADAYWKLESPVGPVYVAHSKAGISMVTRAKSGKDFGKKSDEEFERAFRRRFGRGATREHAVPPASVRALVRKLEGRPGSELRFDLRGLSEFERAVLMKALEIPRGEVRPYSWIAKEIGRPGAVRATGSVLAKNPVPLLIPCHRVVRSDGSIGAYSLGGARNKRTLLELEGAHPETLERLAASGVRYLGSEGGRYYCYPTCGGIETLVAKNKVAFHTAAEAAAAGYRPCEDCRPPLAKAS